MKELPQNYSLYEESYGTEIPTNQIFVNKFDFLPSQIKIKKNFSLEIIDFMLTSGFNLLVENRIQSKWESKESLFINEKKEIMVTLKVSNNNGNNWCSELIFIYSYKNGEFEKQFDLNEINKFISETNKSGINLIKSEMGHLDTENFIMDVPDIDVSLNYGDEFIKIHETIINRLNKDKDKGIILFHGEPGTGKTTYIKYLTKLIKNKEILFVPPSMSESLSEPSIIPFLMEHKNSILIIEDAEKVISDREINGSSAGVSNILNLTDGILGDCLNIQIIATFNMKREKIDTALLRKGRLIAEHKFSRLSIESTNRLLKHLGKEKIVNEEMTLSDIYNIDDEVFKVNNKQNIGFNNNKK